MYEKNEVVGTALDAYYTIFYTPCICLPLKLAELFIRCDEHFKYLISIYVMISCM